MKLWFSPINFIFGIWVNDYLFKNFLYFCFLQKLSLRPSMNYNYKLRKQKLTLLF